ncbi:hypothetical protein ACQI4L_08970 [Mycolicibacterium litorale]|uniref:hypothetical protein n=1 Tax=Mycolicibacterium litorale TaxID=758802 RepID=UPI003CF5BF1C
MTTSRRDGTQIGTLNVQPGMRDIDAIDADLRVIATARAFCRRAGWPPPDFAPADELLDERIYVQTPTCG